MQSRRHGRRRWRRSGRSAPTSRHRALAGSAGRTYGSWCFGVAGLGACREGCRGSDGVRASPRCPSSSPPDPSVRRSVRQVFGGQTHCRSGGRKDIRSFKAFVPVFRGAWEARGLLAPRSRLPSLRSSPPSVFLRRFLQAEAPGNPRQTVRIAVISRPQTPACGLSHRENGPDRWHRGWTAAGGFAVPWYRMPGLAAAIARARHHGRRAQAGLSATFDVNCWGGGAAALRRGG